MQGTFLIINVEYRFFLIVFFCGSHSPLKSLG